MHSRNVRVGDCIWSENWPWLCDKRWRTVTNCDRRGKNTSLNLGHCRKMPWQTVSNRDKVSTCGFMIFANFPFRFYGKSTKMVTRLGYVYPLNSFRCDLPLFFMTWTWQLPIYCGRHVFIPHRRAHQVLGWLLTPSKLSIEYYRYIDIFNIVSGETVRLVN